MTRSWPDGDAIRLASVRNKLVRLKARERADAGGGQHGSVWLGTIDLEADTLSRLGSDFR